MENRAERVKFDLKCQDLDTVNRAMNFRHIIFQEIKLPGVNISTFCDKSWEIIGDWKGLYIKFKHLLDQAKNQLKTMKQIAKNRITELNSEYVSLKVSKVDCSFGLMLEKFLRTGLRHVVQIIVHHN